MSKKRTRRNSDFSTPLNRTRCNQLSNDIVCHICDYLQRWEKSMLAAVCKSFMTGSIVSLLRTVDVNYEVLLQYKHEHHRHQIRKLQLTSKECNDALITFHPKALRYLKITVEGNEDVDSVKKMYSFLQQQHACLVYVVVIYQQYQSVMYQNPQYQLPASVQKLVLDAPYRFFAISEMHNLIHLKVEDNMIVDGSFYAFLKTLPKSIQFLDLSLIAFSDYDRSQDYACHALSNILFLDLQLQTVLTSQYLPNLLSHFSCLQTLSLTNFHLDQNATTTIVMPTTLTHLELKHATVDTVFECPDHISLLRISRSRLKNIKLPVNLRRLDFEQVDYAISTHHMLGEKLTSLRLSSNFNARIYPNVLPNGLETLFFTDDCTEGMFNQLIEHNVLPPRLQTLVFGQAFNQPLLPNVLPSSLTSLHFGIEFDYAFPVGVLLTNLVILTLPMFTQPTVLPSSLTQLNTRFYPFKTFGRSKIPTNCHIYNYRCHDEGYCDFCDIMKKSANSIFNFCLCRCAPCSHDI